MIPGPHKTMPVSAITNARTAGMMDLHLHIPIVSPRRFAVLNLAVLCNAETILSQESTPREVIDGIAPLQIR
jgi:hypothetical protein